MNNATTTTTNQPTGTVAPVAPKAKPLTRQLIRWATRWGIETAGKTAKQVAEECKRASSTRAIEKAQDAIDRLGATRANDVASSAYKTRLEACKAKKSEIAVKSAELAEARAELKVLEASKAAALEMRKASSAEAKAQRAEVARAKRIEATRKKLIKLEKQKIEVYARNLPIFGHEKSQADAESVYNYHLTSLKEANADI